jgi:hypothetical protein
MGYPQRKKHYIDSRVQGALARRIILHWLVFVLVTSVVAFVVQVLSDPFRGLSSHLSDLWWAQGPFLLVMVFLLPVFVMDAIKLSHRFAGPIFNLRRAIRKVAEGETPRKLKFRQADFWHDLADDYNAMLTKLGALEEEKSGKADSKKLTATK